MYMNNPINFFGTAYKHKMNHSFTSFLSYMYSFYNLLNLLTSLQKWPDHHPHKSLLIRQELE